MMNMKRSRHKILIAIRLWLLVFVVQALYQSLSACRVFRVCTNVFSRLILSMIESLECRTNPVRNMIPLLVYHTPLKKIDIVLGVLSELITMRI